MKYRTALACRLVVSAFLLTSAHSAFALEPLSDYLSAGRKNALGNKMADANSQVLDAKASESFWKLFPSITVSGGYTRNDHEVSVTSLIDGRERTVTLLKQNQFDARASLNVTVLDLPAIYRYKAAKAGASQGDYDEKIAAQQVDLQVARAYYSYVAGVRSNAVGASHVDAANQLVQIAQKRVEMKAALPIEVDNANIALDNIMLARDEIQVGANAAKRALVNLSGITPNDDLVTLAPALVDEQPLEHWEAEVANLPTVKSANSALDAANANVTASKYGYAPKINVTASDMVSNNIGFQDSPNVFTLGVTATFNFDLATPATVRGQKAAQKMANLKVQEALAAARELINAAYDQVQLQRGKCKAARNASEIMRRSAASTYESYVRGAAKQEDLLDSQQKSIGAELAEVRVCAEYSFARAVLRILAGQDLVRRPISDVK